MKTTIVPAQITTVEDKIAGSLSISQLMLLTAPIFLGGLFFALLPPLMDLTPLKITLWSALAVTCSLLAIRFKGKILFVWAIVIARYNYRPRYYVFNKNDMHLRSVDSNTKQKKALVIEPAINKSKSKPAKLIPMPEVVRLETALADPRAKFHFKRTRKGNLGVYIKEIK